MSDFTFGIRSSAALATCHDDLQHVLDRALRMSPLDFVVLCGERKEAEQSEYFRTGRSKKRYPDSLHNNHPSNAVDVAPWINHTIDWEDQGTFYILAGVILAAAELEGVAMRWGGDWDRDGATRDNTFQDLGHFELHA